MWMDLCSTLDLLPQNLSFQSHIFQFMNLMLKKNPKKEEKRKSYASYE